jgi:hypothetical protein
MLSLDKPLLRLHPFGVRHSLKSGLPENFVQLDDWQSSDRAQFRRESRVARSATTQNDYALHAEIVVASAVRSTALVVTDKPAVSFICCRP